MQNQWQTLASAGRLALLGRSLTFVATTDFDLLRDASGKGEATGDGAFWLGARCVNLRFDPLPDVHECIVYVCSVGPNGPHT